MDFDPDLIIPDKNLSIAEGAIAVYRNVIDGWRGHYINALAKHYGIDLLAPIKDLKEEQYNVIMYGSEEKIRFNITLHNGDTNWSHSGYWEGLLPQTERLYHQTESDYRRREMEKFMRISPCPKCKGRRLKEKILAVILAGKSIIDITDMSVKSAIKFFNSLKLSQKQADIANAY